MKLICRKIVVPLVLLCGGMSAAPEVHEVAIRGMSYSPAEVTVRAGDSITWTNRDERDHTVKAGDGSFDSGNVSPGKTFTWKFEAVGVVQYGCEYHPRMKGAVTVKE